MFQLEYSTEEDTFSDYCLWRYDPIASCENKLSSANLLFQYFDLAGITDRAHDLVSIIREGIGCSKTVWGLKKFEDSMGLELYFYDYRRRERERSFSKLIDIMSPLVRCGVKLDENLHYFMFSIDLDGDLIFGKRALEEIHLYMGNPGSAVSSGICYSVTEKRKRLENLYFFFDAKREREDILAKVVCSAHADFGKTGIDEILWPELRDCGVIVLANKQRNDSVYFSRINVDQFIFFLKKMGYPKPLVSFVEDNRFRLDHLLYDVGFDYTMSGESLVILKSGYYGIF